MIRNKISLLSVFYYVCKQITKTAILNCWARFIESDILALIFIYSIITSNKYKIHSFVFKAYKNNNCKYFITQKNIGNKKTWSKTNVFYDKYWTKRDKL